MPFVYEIDSPAVLVMTVRVHLLRDFAARQSALSEPGAGALCGTLDQCVCLREVVR